MHKIAALFLDNPGLGKRLLVRDVTLCFIVRDQVPPVPEVPDSKQHYPPLQGKIPVAPVGVIAGLSGAGRGLL